MTKPETQQIENFKEALSFEAAFQQLEVILERMNSSAVSLDESLKLFEDADKLIQLCQKKLGDAEAKVETLIKNRNGELALGPDKKPLVKDFGTEECPF